jgi:hypothetical protein
MCAERYHSWLTPTVGRGITGRHPVFFARTRRFCCVYFFSCYATRNVVSGIYLTGLLDHGLYP